MKIVSTIVTGLVLLLTSMTLQAEQKQSLGSWDIHYSAFASTFLSADVAARYQIKRSSYSGVLNISVLDTKDQQAQKVAIAGSAKNLLGINKSLTFKEMKEGGSIYYIAELDFRNEENYQINLHIVQGNESQDLSFRHTFYVE